MRKITTIAMLTLFCTAAVFAQQKGTFTDSRDKKAYKTVKIGTQTWMAENLNYSTKGKDKCYDNKPANCEKYGRLYDWEIAMKACPEGWHLPNDKEWQTLLGLTGGNEAGKNLKSKSGWSGFGGVQVNGSDKYNFSALPGGYGSSSGNFFYVGNGGYWWSANEGNSQSMNGNNNLMNDDSSFEAWVDNGESRLFSVRCLQN